MHFSTYPEQCNHAIHYMYISDTIWVQCIIMRTQNCINPLIGTHDSAIHDVIMVALCNRETIYIFILFLLLSSFFFLA